MRLTVTRDLLRAMSSADCPPAAAFFGLLMLPFIVAFELAAMVPGWIVQRVLRQAA